MRQIDRSLAAGVAVVGALVVVVAGAFVYGAVAADTSDTAVGPSVSTLDSETTVSHPDNGTVVSQRDPNEAEGHGRMWYVKSHLELRMMQIAANCAESVNVAAPANETNGTVPANETGNATDDTTETGSQTPVIPDNGSDEALCDTFEESYSEKLDRYRKIDTWSETSSTPDIRTNTEPFDQLQDENQEYRDTVSEFRETYRKYQAAKAAGDIQRARALGREVRRLSEEVRQQGNRTLQSFADASNFTGGNTRRNLGPAVMGSLEGVHENATEIAGEVESGNLVRTTINASVSEENASFHDPVLVTGRLDSANGTVPQNATIAIGSNRETVDIGVNGTFQMAYRPSLVAANASSVPVEYVPSNESAYFGSTTEVDLDLEQVYPSVTLTSWDDEVEFGDLVRVEGRVTADGTPVPDVPVSVVVEGIELAVVHTDFNGTFVGVGIFPSSVSSGERTLEARIRSPDMAIGPANATRQFTVDGTATELSLEAVEDESGGIDVEGRLLTGNGTPLHDQSIEIRVGDENVTRVPSDEEGRFNDTVSIPESVLPSSGSVRLQVTAAFDGVGTSLDPSNASATVDVVVDDDSDRNDSNDDDQRDDGDDGSEEGVVARTLQFLDTNPVVAGALVVATLTLLAAAVGIDRPEGSEVPERTTVNRTDTDTGTRSTQQESAGTEGVLESARGRYDDGDHEECVLLSYSAVRRTLPVSVPPGATHWEVYRACHEAGFDDERLTDLRSVTEAFEHTTFAAAAVTDEEAEQALVAAASLVERPG